jgi:ABC-2 type transport system permease protein
MSVDQPTLTPPHAVKPHAFRALATAIVKGFYRDKATVFFSIFFPLFFILIFGTVFGGDGGASKEKLIPIGSVAFLDEAPAELKAALNEVFEVQPPQDLASAEEAVRKGDASAALEQRGDTLVLHIARADVVAAATVQGVLSSFVDKANLAASGVPPRLALDVAQVEDESLQPIQYVAPGMIAYGITIGATFGSAMTLITWRKSKLLRRLRLAPVSTAEVVGSRVIVSIAVAILQLAMMLGVAMMLGLQLNGAWYMSVPLVLAGTIAFLAVGLLVGAISKTVEGGSGLANLIITPMGFLSGAFIPLAAAPAWLVAVSKVMPMSYLVTGLSDVMVRGQGPAAALIPIVIMLAFAAVVTWIATKLFKWEV